VDADWYAGNAHKWLCAPRGAGWLAARDAAAAALVRPLATSHAHGQGFAAAFDMIGTRDHSAWLSIPDAIAFHAAMGGPALRARARAVARAMGETTAAALGTECSGPAAMGGSMAAIRLPFDLPPTRETVTGLRRSMWESARIDANISPLHDALWLRLSAAPYVDAEDAEGVAEAVTRAATTLARGLSRA
jgi:isopenicillin-N epimerase